MRAMKCDRCGKFYEYYEGRKAFEDTEKANAVCFTDIDMERNYSDRKTYDLCLDCMEELEDFLKNKYFREQMERK